MGEVADLLDTVRGLHGYWERRSRHQSSPPEDWMAERMLLDALGIGLEQAHRHFAAGATDPASFAQWIVETAGPPEPATINRYHAALDGAAPPSETAAKLAAVDAMPPVFDAENLAHWDEQGYVVLRRAITPDEAAAAAAVVWDAAGADPADPASWYGDAQQGLMIQCFQHRSLEVARRSRRVHKAFAQLWGDSDLWMTIDRVSLNPPETAAHPFRAPRLHWDAGLVPPIPFATQGILYLADTAEDQGAFELVPGFHHHIEAWLAGLDSEVDPRAVDLSDHAIRIPGQAGDLVIWRQDLPHGASPNRTDRPRIAQYVNMYSPRMELQIEWR